MKREFARERGLREKGFLILVKNGLRKFVIPHVTYFCIALIIRMFAS